MGLGTVIRGDTAPRPGRQSNALPRWEGGEGFRQAGARQEDLNGRATGVRRAGSLV